MKRLQTLALLLTASTAFAGEHGRAGKGKAPHEVAAAVDALLERHWRAEKVTPAPLADDAEFLRRVCLDVTGRLPSPLRAAAFLDDRAPDKRARLIDELLASPAYGRYFGRTWRNLMIRPDANMPNPPNTEPLAAWLAARFNENRGWDRIVVDILQAGGPDQVAPATFFVLNGDGRGNPLANVTAGSVAKLFMGAPLECAECHKHPFAEWKQDDFWGLAAFFGHVNNAGRGNVTEDRKTRGGKRSISIRTGPGASIVIPDTSFRSVGKFVRARFPGGAELAEGVDGPLRPALARWLTAPKNPYFAANAANRLWGHFFGRPLADTIDPSDRSPSAHSAVLEHLTAEFVASGFDQKHLIRCVCNSRTYQHASRPTRKEGDVPFAQAAPRVLGPEVLYEALCSALELPELAARKKRSAARAAFIARYTTRPEGGDPTEYAYGIPQALTLLNQEVFRGGGRTVDRLLREQKKPAEVVEQLHLATLSRRPTPDETADAVRFVERRKGSRQGYADVLWALVNSAEFILNH